jgi:hypothetical protein
MEDDLGCRRLGRVRPAAAGSDEARRKSAVSRARWRSRIPARRESVRRPRLVYSKPENPASAGRGSEGR